VSSPGQVAGIAVLFVLVVERFLHVNSIFNNFMAIKISINEPAVPDVQAHPQGDSLRSVPPALARYIKQKQEVEQKKERIKYYEEILKFRESRYPQELMSQLEREINPFELSIDKLKEFYNSKFPQYSN
jgi:hypothetical protein